MHWVFDYEMAPSPSGEEKSIDRVTVNRLHGLNGCARDVNGLLWNISRKGTM
jgi:hypothetical protein